MHPASLYIHIPFCLHRCGYCDFNSYAGLEGMLPEYSKALCRELQLLVANSPERIPIHSVYFGGGTPSLLPTGALCDIVTAVGRYFELTSSTEITLEVNPGTVSKEYLGELAGIGVNRLSLGMQSAHSDELRLLDRQHTFHDVVNAVEWSRSAGITNLNLDLIYGLPDQKHYAWMHSLKWALSLQPEHLSLYALTLEAGTPMHQQVHSGALPAPDPDLAADMYEFACENLACAGYQQYEISNWARDNAGGEAYSCIHNLQYWRNLPYIGSGAGAHGYIGNQRTVNIASPAAYIRRMKGSREFPVDKIKFPRTPATVQIHNIDTETEIGETMMMGLRLVIEGISRQAFLKRFGVNLEQRFGATIERLICLGLLEWFGEGKEVLRLTDKGKLLGNQVFAEFI